MISVVLATRLLRCSVARLARKSKLVFGPNGTNGRVLVFATARLIIVAGSEQSRQLLTRFFVIRFNSECFLGKTMTKRVRSDVMFDVWLSKDSSHIILPKEKSEVAGWHCITEVENERMNELNADATITKHHSLNHVSETCVLLNNTVEA